MVIKENDFLCLQYETFVFCVLEDYPNSDHETNGLMQFTAGIKTKGRARTTNY